MKPSGLSLALLWHQHQPCYGSPSLSQGKVLPVPWVRLHALRDYYSMAALVAQFPAIHLTISLTPVLLSQIEDYVTRGATDHALELTRTPTSDLTAFQRSEIEKSFFAADWRNEIFPYPRYKFLLENRGSGKPLSDRDITDLRMWFNLAWFAPEFKTSSVRMPDGSTASVKPFIEKGSDFEERDITAMVDEQYKILRNVIAIHRQLQDAGRIEIASCPFYHPILPLLHDTDLATLDRVGSERPGRFAYPQDAAAQTRDAAKLYTRLFGRPPVGMWPAEGAVGESVIGDFTREHIRWIASDAGVLKRSGQWGYDAHRPELLGKAWRAGSDDPEACVAIFFRDTELSDAVGFRYGSVEPGQAVDDFISTLKRRYAGESSGDRIVSVILDGENAWGSYQQAGRPFLTELYRRLTADTDIVTVTFSEWLQGSPERGVAAHPLSTLERVCDLANASWIDERGSLPANDLGTWVGEPAENSAWELLRAARSSLERRGTPLDYPDAYQAIYAAEGSDWFWWLGDDQNCDADPLFDDLFRQHLRAAYHLSGVDPPEPLYRPLARVVRTWSFTDRTSELATQDQLRIQVGSPGIITWWYQGKPKTVHEVALRPFGGAMAGLNVYTATLGPFKPEETGIEFRFSGACAPAHDTLSGPPLFNTELHQVRFKDA